MSIPGSPNLLLMRQAAAAVPTGYQLPASCRFTRGDEAYLLRTFAAGNQRTFTVSFWVKRTKLGGSDELQILQSANGSGPRSGIWFNNHDNGNLWIEFNPTGSSGIRIKTTRVFRDPASFYHIVIAVDTTQAVNADRVKVYVNGIKETAFGQYDTITQDLETFINAAVPTSLGRYQHGSGSNYLDAYLSDFQFVDGMALHPSCWGEFSSTTGDWNPKELSLQVPNNGTTWSDYLTTVSGSFHTNHPKEYAFNGNLSNFAGENQNGVDGSGNLHGIKFIPPAAFENVATFRYRAESVGSKMTFRIYDGSNWTQYSDEDTIWDGSNTAWRDASTLIPANRTIEKFEYLSYTGGHAFLGAIEINGVLLIDDKTDNSASINDGRVWSTYMSATGGWLSSGAGVPYSPDRTFNGDVPNMGNANVQTYGATAGGTITFAPTGGIVYKDKVELYTDQGSNYTVNGGSSQSFGPASGQSNGTWYTVATGSGTLNTLTWTPQNNSYHPSSAAMRIDGQLMIDGIQSLYGRNGCKLLSNGFSASRPADIGKDYANGLIATANGGKPILTTTDNPNYGDTTGGSVATDSLSSSLKFAIAGNTTANITDDKSGNSNDPTKSGTVVTNGNESRFYGTSMDFGNSAGRLFVNDADVTIGTNQFCMEGWFYPTNSDGNNKTALSGNWSGTQGFLLCFDRSDVANDGWCFIQGTTSSETTITAANTHPIDTWTHVAVTRDSSNKIRLFVNGVEEASATNTNNIATTEFGIGSVYSGSQTEGWDGLVQDVRLYVGASKYEASFTPPIRNDWKAVNLVSGDSVNYSSGGSGSTNAGSGFDKMFDGLTSTLMNGSGSATSEVTVTFNPALTVQSVEVNPGSLASQYKINSGSYTTITDDGTYHSLNFSGTLTTLTIKGDSGTNAAPRCEGMKVDGILLIDANKADIFSDTPTSYGDGTSGGDVRGNFCTLNTLDTNFGSNLQQGNLKAVGSSSWSAGHARGTFALTSGKWYWEATKAGGSGAIGQFGFANKDASLSESYGSAPANIWTFYFGNGTEIIVPAANCSGYFSGSAMADGDTAGVALDMDNGTWQFFKNGTAGAVKNLVDTDTASTTSITELFPWVGAYSSNVEVNFGQRAWAYPSSVPSGFKALCTQNFPTPTITNPAEYMTAAIYTGDGRDDRPLTLGFKPGMIWQKKRNGSDSHHVIDQKRGGTDVLYTDANSAANAQGGDGAVNAWTATGVELNDEVGVNQDNSSFVMWGWEANTTFSNSAGTNSATIASEGRYNANTGFSIVKYVSTGTSDTKVFHKLSAAPKFIIIKNFDGTQDWGVYHAGIGNADGILLNTNGAKQGSPSDWWNGTSPDSNVFTLGNKDTVNNSSSHDYIAYCWSEVAGFSSFGTYKGNNSTDGTCVHCGFAPKLVVVKTTNTTGNWVMYDRARLRYNPNPYVLLADDPGGGSTHDAWVGSYPIDFLSNGFKLRGNTGEMNGTNDFIYMAWAESPFSTARAR